MKVKELVKALSKFNQEIDIKLAFKTPTGRVFQADEFDIVRWCVTYIWFRVSNCNKKYIEPDTNGFWEEEYFISKPESENDRDNIADLKKQVSNLEKQVAELIEQAFRRSEFTQSEFRKRMCLAVQDGDRNVFR
jgi:hypothetical protein